MGSLGFLGIRYPEAYGGSEMDTMGSVVLAEELGRSTFSGVAITALVHTDMASVHVLHAGSEAQKAKWMRKIVAGEAICAVAVTEPDAGSDVKAIRTTAQVRDGGFVLNGAKMFITNGVHADLYCVAAKTGGAGGGSKAVTMFLVEKGRPGSGSAARWTNMVGAPQTRLNWCSRIVSCRETQSSARWAGASMRSCGTSRTSAS